MDITEAISARHSVRNYKDTPIEPEKLEKLRTLIDEYNRQGDLHIQLITDEPEAFDNFKAHYGKFSGVKNYIALVGKKGLGLEEKLGYYGEKLVLEAQTMDLNTCWVASSYSKNKCKASVSKGEKLIIVIALGYGEWPGTAHKSKPMDMLCRVNGEKPEWFRKGMEAAMLAPTAVNHQRFLFTLHSDGSVTAVSTGGVFSLVDLGIVKCHFEIGAKKSNFTWRDLRILNR